MSMPNQYHEYFWEQRFADSSSGILQNTDYQDKKIINKAITKIYLENDIPLSSTCFTSKNQHFHLIGFIDDTVQKKALTNCLKQIQAKNVSCDLHVMSSNDSVVEIKIFEHLVKEVIKEEATEQDNILVQGKNSTVILGGFVTDKSRVARIKTKLLAKEEVKNVFDYTIESNA